MPNNSGIVKEQERTLIKEKMVIPTQTDKNPSQKTVLNPKLQALFARSNSPKENPAQIQMNPIQNTNALLNKFNLPIKFGNNKEETNIMTNKGSPKAGGQGNPNQTIKLQDQIKQLQQEHILLQKKTPQIYQNVPQNNNKPPANYTLANKFSNNNDAFTGTINSKNIFAENSGSPKGQATPNSKQNFGGISDQSKNLKNGQESNFLKGKNDLGGLGQNPANLYQNLLNQKGKK